MAVTVPGPGGRRSAPMTPAAWLTCVLFGAMVVAALVDLAVPNRLVLLPIVLAPILSAVLLPPRAAAALSAASVFFALVLPEAFWSSSGTQYVRLTSVAGLAALAVMAAVLRERLVSARVRLARERSKAEQARRQALEVNDSVYQDLFAARMWSQMGQPGRAEEALDRALAGAAQVVVDLVEGVAVHPGSLVRQPAEPPAPVAGGPAPSRPGQEAGG